MSGRVAASLIPNTGNNTKNNKFQKGLSIFGGKNILLDLVLILRFALLNLLQFVYIAKFKSIHDYYDSEKKRGLKLSLHLNPNQSKFD